MTDEEIRIAIAEACGYERLKGDPWKSTRTIAFIPKGWSVERFIRHGEPAVYPSMLPDYLDDLNAMHEAEATLTDEQHTKFRVMLAEVVRDVRYFCRKYTSATARQRAEAFLRTLNLWKD